MSDKPAKAGLRSSTVHSPHTSSPSSKLPTPGSRKSGLKKQQLDKNGKPTPTPTGEPEPDAPESSNSKDGQGDLDISLLPPKMSISHRNLEKCPCGQTDKTSWRIDCSGCNQFWHVDCLGLGGLGKNEYNKLMDFLCPFCYVAPVPTIKNENNDICYICRNTLSLQQANSVFETKLSSEKLNSLQGLTSAINSIDLEKFSTNVGIIQNFDLHLQHLLLKQNSLEEYQGSVKEIEKRTSDMSSSLEKNMAEISGQISSLQSQVDELSASPAHNTPPEADNSGEVLASIAAKLDELYSQEPIVHRQLNEPPASVVSADSPHDPLNHLQGASIVQDSETQFIHGEEAVSHSVDEFIDCDLETSLLDLFESSDGSFKSENGHSVLSYGEKYRYTGSRSSAESNSSAIPPAIAQLIEKLNNTFCDDGKPQLNSCLVNRYDGSLSFLPQHSDDEAVIHPESSIFTLSLGHECSVTFTESKSSATQEHTCKPRSLYSMTRKSQQFFKHHIEAGSISSGVRYSLTFRSVDWRNRNATCIIGDSNTGGLKFGSDRARTFGDLLPGRQFYAPVIDKINPYDTTGYNNTVILCGINDIRDDKIKNKNDIRSIFNRLSSKIEKIQAINPKSHIYICPILPTKLSELNRKALCFNNLIFTELIPSNFGVTCVIGFDDFLDANGLLHQDLSRRLTRFKKPDNLHLNWKGVAQLARTIKNTVLLRMNGGVDRRQRTSHVNGRPYSEVAAGGVEHQDGYQP